MLHNPHFSAFNFQLALREHPDRFRISRTLLLEDAFCQPVRSIVVQDRHGALAYDRPMIIDVVGKVYGTTGDFDASIKHGFMDMMTVEALAAKGGDQRRMDVHDPGGIVVRDANELQEAGHADQLGLRFPAITENLRAEFFHRRAFLTLHDGRGYAGFLRP